MSVQSCNSPGNTSITSPDGQLKLDFFLKKGEPFYALSRGGEEIILPSSMGFEFKNMPPMKDNFKIVKATKDSVNITWEQPWGQFKKVRDNHKELSVTLQEKSGDKRILHIIFRVFDDGLGFRYEFPEQPNADSLVIINELTQFTFTREQKVWWIPVHSENSYYESLFRLTKMGETDTINTPATFEMNDGSFLAIHEAALTDYASMTLLLTDSNQYESDLVPWSNGVKVYGRVPFQTPWRTILVGDTPGDLAMSNLTLNLNEPCVLDDISWIEPTKYIGIWWAMHLDEYTWGQGPKHGATTQNAKRYIDFAAENGFGGVLIEGWNLGWDGNWAKDGSDFNFTTSYPDFDLEEVCRYGAKKNVRIIGHHETAGAVFNYEKQLEDAFALYHRYGVNSVKTGYVNKYLDGKEWHDGQFGVRHYRNVVETAARYKIMIDNHEPVKGTGLERTYPNLMAQEGGRGQEYNAWSADGGNPPSHTTIIPFTRMLAGPFDFTPGIFNFDYHTAAGAKVQTTLAKQLALYVIIFSPLQMAADIPWNYENVPAFQFVKDVPCNWSESKVLNGIIGEFVTIVRKDYNSEEWYLGTITNEKKRNISVDLSFLEEGITYLAQIYEDGVKANYKDNPTDIHIIEKKVTKDSGLSFKLAPGGGAAVRFVPIVR
ncbi:glycoside hydrolase family 97 protein [Anaerophaga thermohalophila]|uniref:glycoside hydrolase family 97 protein n=1 Tax=Anaerophaga thermohalophila TaxID=177400 RepID=UPI0002F6B19D|nr:glycoside hydrolase family 97 protein [Anaerophaga thermohalophila]